jgi:hypothetical protein
MVVSLTTTGGYMYALLTILLLAVAPVAEAQPRFSDVTSIPMERCTVPEVHGYLKYQSIEAAAAIAKQQIKPLERLQALSDKGKSDRPLIESLTKEEASQWGQAQQQLGAGTLMSMIESRRQRDLDLLLKQVQLADQEYRWRTTPSEGTPDSKPYGFLVMLRMLWKGSTIGPPEGPPCSLNAALAKLQAEPLEKLNKYAPQLDKGLAWVKQTNAKYKLAKIDEEKYSPAERDQLNTFRREVLYPASIASTYLEDLQNVRVMAKAADSVYESDRADAAIAGGDADVVGATIRRRTDAGEFDENTQVAIGVWRLVNEQIPSDYVRQILEAEKSGRLPVKPEAKKK